MGERAPTTRRETNLGCCWAGRVWVKAGVAAASHSCTLPSSCCFASPYAAPRPTLFPSTPRWANHSPTYFCRFTAKYKALGADAVRFVNSELTNVALVKAGRNVLISYRSTFTHAQNANTMKECELLSAEERGPRDFRY